MTATLSAVLAFVSPEKAQATVTKLLNESFWLPNLKTNQRYLRCQDDHDGTFFPKISVIVSEDADIWMATLSDRPSPLHSLRFRCGIGGGSSLRVRNALLILAEAIRQDSLERPVPEDDI